MVKKIAYCICLNKCSHHNFFLSQVENLFHNWQSRHYRQLENKVENPQLENRQLEIPQLKSQLEIPQLENLQLEIRNSKAPATGKPSSNNLQLVIIKLNIQAKWFYVQYLPNSLQIAALELRMRNSCRGISRTGFEGTVR